ncbi:MAG: gamma carbonic anhydrase family protein [Pseudomonadales bacterium]|nr:gamma carbonic anhydrase family protein [Pseudomonadales bacterium]
MIRKFAAHVPQIDESAWISETALVMGHVIIGPDSGIWPGAVLRGDFAVIRIGAGTVIEDNVVVHSGDGIAVGNNVIVGHGAVLHCREIGDNTLIANNATVLDDAVIGKFCVIGAGCVVSPGMVIPDHSLVLGVPGRITGAVSDKQLARLRKGNASYIPMFEQYRRDGI